MDAKPVVLLALGVGALGLLIAVVVGGGGGGAVSVAAVGSDARSAQEGSTLSGDYASERARRENSDTGSSSAGATGSVSAPVDLQARRPDQARSEDQGRRGRGRGDWSSRMEERIAEFDLNGDGALSIEEREAMLASFRDRMVERFDSDGDGFVSVDEMLSGRRQMMLDSPRGDRIRARYDSDGDGVLSAEEEAAMDASFAEQDAERMQGMIDRYDTDGDGEMSREETVAMQESWMDRQRSFFDSMTERYDQDGDGMLNIDERDDARAEFIDRREKDRFLERYDTNGDKSIDASDHAAFVEAYYAKEPHADVNRDGVINMDDLSTYRDYAESINTDAAP